MSHGLKLSAPACYSAAPHPRYPKGPPARWAEPRKQRNWEVPREETFAWQEPLEGVRKMAENHLHSSLRLLLPFPASVQARPSAAPLARNPEPVSLQVA